MWQRLKAWFEAHLPLPAWQRRPKWHWSLLAIIGLLILFFPYPITSAAPQERFFRLEASQFSYNPGVIKVNPGDQVTIELVALDVVHGLAIDGYDVQTSADPGQTASLSFVADRQGSFRFRCTETCGNMHPFMIGKIQVGHNDLLWRAGLLASMLLLGVLWRAIR
jgi:heme/copper-type cytochrome/quinol oxidase subunit 2